ASRSGPTRRRSRRSSAKAIAGRYRRRPPSRGANCPRRGSITTRRESSLAIGPESLVGLTLLAALAIVDGLDTPRARKRKTDKGQRTKDKRMNGLLVLAQAATNVDPNAIGVSITSLLGSLGAAGAAVAVTYYFLGFLRNEGQKQDRIFSEFRDYHAESQKKFQDQLERLADPPEQFQPRVQDQGSPH